MHYFSIFFSLLAISESVGTFSDFGHSSLKTRISRANFYENDCCSGLNLIKLLGALFNLTELGA
jgi:hypothetical protein